MRLCGISKSILLAAILAFVPSILSAQVSISPGQYVNGSGVARGGIQLPDYLQLTTVNTSAAAAGDCDAAAETGRQYWDSTNDNFYICSGASGWVKVTSGVLTYPGAGLPVSTGSAWGTSLSSTAPIFTGSVTTGAIATQSVLKFQGTTDASPFTYAVAAPDLSADAALTLANGSTTLVAGTMVPTSLTVAGKALSGNITLACSDLSDEGTGCAGAAMAYPGAGIGVSSGSAWSTSLSATAPIFNTSVTAGVIATDSVIKIQGTTDASPFTYTIAAPDLSGDAALTLANGSTTLVAGTMVPTSLTVAGKGLSGNITIACSDLSDEGTGCAGAAMSWPGDGIPVASTSSWGTSLSSTAPIFSTSVTAGLIASQDVITVAPLTSATRFTGTLSTIDLTADHAWNFPNKDGTVAMTSDITGSTAYVTAQTGTYSVDSANGINQVVVATANTFTITLYAASGKSGYSVSVKNTGTGTITIDGNGSETIDGQTTVAISAQYGALTLVCDGSNWFVL